MSFKLDTVEAERANGPKITLVKKWHYRIKTGSRCKGLLSSHKYKCPVAACLAGERMINKLQGMSDG